MTAIISLNSFREVANAEMVRLFTHGMVGHAQVHGRGYQASPELSNVVPDARAVEASLVQAIPGARAEKRVIGASLAGSGESSTAVLVMGIEPANPGTQSLLTVKQGRALGASSAREVVLGETLAEELGLEPGSERVLVGQAADGSLANDRYTVVGTADAGSFEANASSVFLPLSEAQSFFGLGEGVHQVIVRLPVDDDERLAEPVSLLRGALDLQSVEGPWTPSART